jgi:hypothetical protein
MMKTMTRSVTKALTLGLLSTMALSSGAKAATLAAQPLKCGGFVSLDSNGSQVILSVKKVGASTCQSLEIQSENIRGALNKDLSQMQIRNLGRQLVLVVDSEVVILTVDASVVAAERSNEIEAQRLKIEQDRAAREKARQNAEAAGAAIAVGAAGAAVTVEAVNSIER